MEWGEPGGMIHGISGLNRAIAPKKNNQSKRGDEFCEQDAITCWRKSSRTPDHSRGGLARFLYSFATWAFRPSEGLEESETPALSPKVFFVFLRVFVTSW
jgi:hypothetical protein